MSLEIMLILAQILITSWKYAERKPQNHANKLQKLSLYSKNGNYMIVYWR